MSASVWRGLKFAAALLIAGVLQAAFADGLQVWGGRPDLLLTTALVGAMFCGEDGSALLGFCSALMHASLAAPPHAGVGSILVSRTLVAFGVGWMADRVYRDSALVALLVVVGGTLVAECLFLILCPQPALLLRARILVLTMAWNGALAMPCYFAIRALLGRHREAEEQS